MDTILEALQNANINLSENPNRFILEKGYDLDVTEVEPLLDQYGDVENVPEA